MRVISFNANGIRSASGKGFLTWMRRQKPEVVCIQETRADLSVLPRRMRAPRGFWAGFHTADRPGYSGVAIYAAREPDRIQEGLGWPEIDVEGRFLRADFGRLSVISFYMPSGSSGEPRQSFKFELMKRLIPLFEAFMDDGREYILTGDFNIAHRKIDLENWRGNQKNSGFLPEERAWLDTVYDDVGLVDAFRAVCPEPQQYTWWSNRGQAWKKNVGWRLDLQVVTPRLAKRVVSASIYKRKRFSDHAPLTIDYDWDL